MLKLKLHIFPLLQILCFFLAIYFYRDHLGLAILSLFLSALFLNFSLHITIHHFVHFPFKNKSITTFFEWFYTLTMCLPYNFYRMQHFNHHRYDNLIGDFTTTWKEQNNKIIPRNVIGYSFFWFSGGSMNKFIQQALKEGDLTPERKSKIQLESLLILLFILGLFLTNPFFAILYLILFYLGWSLIAITNYGQHLPLKYGETIAYSYHNKFYNWIFFNNGLHYEHHKNPNLNYPLLKAGKVSKMNFPHLLIPLLKKRK